VVGALLSALFSYWYAIQFPLNTIGFHQPFMVAAINFGCTESPFSWVPTEGWTRDDEAGAREVKAFLNLQQMAFPCASFPRHISSSILNGMEWSNEEAPIYLSMIYGTIWKIFGVQWQVTYYVISIMGALIFLVIYWCARAFVPSLLAAVAGFSFLCGPIMLANLLDPRDSMKIPFVLATAAVLVGRATRPRRPGRFVLFACGVGLLIGVGYGFRPDLLAFLAPAAVVIGILGQPELPDSGARRYLIGAGLRIAAVGSLVACFVVGGALPIWNDYVVHPDNKYLGFHVMGMGQEGTHDVSLFQTEVPAGQMYLFRNDWISDLAIMVRTQEYALRRDGADTQFVLGSRYWNYAHQFYLSVVRLIPADILSNAIGAFVNVMTVPANLEQRPPQNSHTFNENTPWVHAYSFIAKDHLFAPVLLGLDKIYRFLAHTPLTVAFLANLIVLFVFLCLIHSRWGIRSAIAMIILLGASIMVTSLDFEMRHMLYLYTYTLVSWVAVAWVGVAAAASLIATARKSGVGEARLALSRTLRASRSSVAAIAAAFAVVIIIAGASLEAARAYQAPTLRGVIGDWLDRQKAPAKFAIVPLSSDNVDWGPVPPGMSLIRVQSPMPRSTGGERAADDPVRAQPEMGVVAVEFDGQLCRDRVIEVTGYADSVPSPLKWGTAAWALSERFRRKLERGVDYTAFIPAYYYYFNAINGTDHETRFAGIILPTNDTDCVNRVDWVTDFKRTDVLFDYFIPIDLNSIRDGDLYHHVFIPLIGYI